jgi:uncharacterized protein
MTERCANALIVFVKNPVPGRVKTRLAATIGDERAFDIYMRLLSHTMTVASLVDADLVICYSDYIPENDAWSILQAHRSTQKGDDLGECMLNALSSALKTHECAVLVGSDCGELTTEVIDRAFDSLADVDAVIGPAMDGGYYLVGTNKAIPGMFESVDWSTSHVLFQTLSRLLDAGLNFALGKTMRDVDTESDWEALRNADAHYDI